MSTPTPDEQALTEQIAEAVRPILRRRALMSDVDLPAYIARALLPVMKTAQRDAARAALDGLHDDAQQDYRLGAQGDDQGRMSAASAVMDAAAAWKDHYPEETL